MFFKCETQCEIKIQWHLSIGDMLYSGHLSIADTIHKNRWNHGHVLLKNLFIADRNSGHLFIADKTFGNQWQFCIEIDLSIADSQYQSKFIRKLQCFCTNKNIIKAYLLNFKRHSDV